LKGKCDVVQEYFTFYTILKNPNIKSLKEAVIPIEVNGKKIYSKTLYAIPFLMGHSVWFFNGGYNVEKHIKFYENIKVHRIKILSNDGSIKNFKAEDYFDIIHNEWNVQNVKNVLLEAKDKCEKLSVQTKKSKLESHDIKERDSDTEARTTDYEFFGIKLYDDAKNYVTKESDLNYTIWDKKPHQFISTDIKLKPPKPNRMFSEYEIGYSAKTKKVKKILAQHKFKVINKNQIKICKEQVDSVTEILIKKYPNIKIKKNPQDNIMREKELRKITVKGMKKRGDEVTKEFLKEDYLNFYQYLFYTSNKKIKNKIHADVTLEVSCLGWPDYLWLLFSANDIKNSYKYRWEKEEIEEELNSSTDSTGF